MASGPDEEESDGLSGDAWTYEDLHRTRHVYGHAGAIFSLCDEGAPSLGLDFFGDEAKDGEKLHDDRFELETASNDSHRDESLGPVLEQASQRSPCDSNWPQAQGLLNSRGRALSDLVPFAAGGTNPGEEMEALAARFAELRVEGEAEGGTFSDWDVMLEILLEFHGMSVVTVTGDQLDRILQVSCDVGIVTPEEGQMVKKALVKLKANQLMRTMDGKDCFSSRRSSDNSAVSSSLSRGDSRGGSSRSSRGSSFVLHSPSSSFSMGGKEAAHQALIRTLSSSEKWKSSTMDGNLFGSLRVPGRTPTFNPSTLSAVDGKSKSCSMDEIDFRNIFKASSKDAAKSRKFQKFLKRSADSRSSLEKHLRSSVDSLGGIREEASETSSFQGSLAASFQSSVQLSPGSSFQTRRVAMIKGAHGGSFGKRGARDGKASTKDSGVGARLGTKDSMESVSDFSSIDEKSTPGPWFQRIVSNLVSPFSGNRSGQD